MKPISLSEIHEGKVYNTEKATLLTGNDRWDGNNYERHGRQTYLYRTANGAYFMAHLTQWIGESNHLEPITEDEALKFWELAREYRVEFSDAFPSVQLEEA